MQDSALGENAATKPFRGFDLVLVFCQARKEAQPGQIEIAGLAIGRLPAGRFSFHAALRLLSFPCFPYPVHKSLTSAPAS